jgi:hypothetical protein
VLLFADTKNAEMGQRDKRPNRKWKEPTKGMARKGEWLYLKRLKTKGGHTTP